jgi:O-glycosyl hydrolase
MNSGRIPQTVKDWSNMFENVSHRRKKRHLPLWLSLLLVFFAALAHEAQAQYSTNVNFNTKYQTFEGWGTSLAWWANVVGGYPDANRNDYVSRVFDPTYGLGLNIVRYNIGGGENPKYLAPNSQYLQFRANMPGFLASPTASYDWTQDANQRWVLQQSIQKGVTVAEAFSNSPPWWMTNSGSVTGSTDGGNNLNPTYNSAFADYLTSVVQQYHDTWGITFRTLEPFNEPSSTWWKFGGTQEGSGFDAGTQNSFVKVLGASLAAKNITYTSVSASDENSIDQAVDTFAAMDASALGYMGQVNTHTYNGSNRNTLMTDAANASKRLSVSEYGDGDATGLTMAAQILTDLKGMQPKNWIYWQAVDNSGGWGFLNNALDGTSNYGYAFNEKYYVMGNFSKFIRPGYQFIDIDDSNSVAAYDGNGALVIVTVNSSTTAQEVTYNLQNIPAAMGAGPWNVQAYRTSATENLAAQPMFQVSGSTFYRRIPANSVTTFVITNATTIPVVDGAQYILYTDWNYSSNISGGDIKDTQVVEEGSWDTTAGKQLDVWSTGQSTLGSSSTGANQVWIAHTAGGSNWVFTNLNSENKGNALALDVAGTSIGSKVVQNPRTDNVSQLWSLDPVNDGSNSYRIVNTQSGLDLEMTGWWGSGLDLDSETNSQKVNGWTTPLHWHLIPFQGAPVPTSLAMTYPTPVYVSSDLQLTVAITTTSPVAPTGTVTFYDGDSELGQATLSGTGNTVAFTVGSLSAGDHYVTAVYSGDGNNMPSATTETLINSLPLWSTSTTLSSSATSVNLGQNVTLTATITTTSTTSPTGTVNFTAGSTALATVPVTGNTVTYTTSSLPAGAYSITANYSGDSSNAASSSSALLLTVNAGGVGTAKVSTSFSPSIPLVGNSIDLTATVSGSGATPTGSVYFIDGSSVVGGGAIGSNGSVTFSTSSLSVGTHSLTAYYTGDTTYAAATSSAESLTVYAVPVGDYALASSVKTMSLTGSSQQAYISVVTSGGFTQPIVFSCSGLPQGYNCAFSPSSITPSGTGVQTVKMAITNQSTAMLEHSRSGQGLMALAGIFLLGLPLCWRSHRKLLGTICILVLSCWLGVAISGCNSTSHASYTVTVTGTSLPLTHTVTIQVQK